MYGRREEREREREREPRRVLAMAEMCDGNL